MPHPVTEIAYIPLRENTSLDSGQGKSIWDATLRTIASQKGFRRLVWGMQVERPDVAQMAIDWASLDDHKAFMESSAYGPFLDHLKPVLGAAPPFLFHVAFPSPSRESASYSPFDAPITECISMFFDPSVDAAAYDESFSAFCAEAAKVQGSEATGIIGGWGVEMQTVDGEGEAEEKKFFGAFIGWPSVDAHMEFRKKEEFPRIVGFLRQGTSAVKMHHVAFKRFDG